MDNNQQIAELKQLKESQGWKLLIKDLERDITLMDKMLLTSIYKRIEDRDRDVDRRIILLNLIELPDKLIEEKTPMDLPREDINLDPFE